MLLKIGTLNCQNNTENRQNRNDRANLLAEHILSEGYDILGTQELTMKFTKKLDNYLREYHFYGDYQYGRGFFGTRFPIIKSFNQANKIITYYPVESTRTKILPWIPTTLKELKKAIQKKSIARRIMTTIEIETEKTRIYIINTHLDYYLPNIQKRQLNYLIKKIEKLRNYGLVVVMGDFNLQVDNPMFLEFIDALDRFDIVRVPINEKTNDIKYDNPTAIDHIFIPREWEILRYGTKDPESLKYITDHKALYVEVDTH